VEVKEMKTRFSASPALALLVSLALLGLVSEAMGYESKSSWENMVQVEVKPVQLTAGKPASFEVSMNTHSVDLSQDLTAVATLKDDQGREYKPWNWQGSSPGGHHRSGTLAFPALAVNAKSVTLIIRKIADVPERSFQWQLEK
jgi:hypothetical protein